MEIEIDDQTTPRALRLAQADDFTVFRVIVRGDTTTDSLGEAIHQIGRRADDEHVFVEVDALMRLPGARPEDVTSWVRAGARHGPVLEAC
jgi:hypothetical protein